ncbi:MAG: hypothetical protein IBX46_13000 [Desulfuromonadales bacterium]|nr:hypothetical protein [Desulfuromonadales bacterium]
MTEIEHSLLAIDYVADFNQTDYNRRISAGLVSSGWQQEQRVVNALGLRCDFEKNGVWVEVEFGNARSYYQGYVKFMLAKKYREARLGLLLCPTNVFAGLLCELGSKRAQQDVVCERFSGSTESVIDQDLAAIEDLNGGLDRLVSQLRLWHGGLVIEPGHFAGWSLGARFYPVLYMLTRVGAARDWGTGLPLKSSLLGQMSRLEVHHIFPKAQLYKKGYERSDVNAVANFCFLTKLTNLNISDTRPEIYFPQIEQSHPGALASQWIPMDPELWKMENYQAFLAARRELLAKAANEFMLDLLHGDDSVLKAPVAAASAPTQSVVAVPVIIGGIDNEDEEYELQALMDWVTAQFLPEGSRMYEIVDPNSGAPIAMLDLAWPNGLQEGFSQPVTVLLNEEAEVHNLANSHGFRYFTNVEDFKQYVLHEVMGEAL